MKLVLAVSLFTVTVLAADPQDDRQAFQGTWTIVERQKADSKEPVTAPTVVFAGDKYQIKAGDKVVEEGTFQVDGAKSPKLIEVAATAGMDKGKKWHGIYQIEGDTLRAAVGPTDKDRPTKYDNPVEGVRTFVLKREPKK
ncbi:MAG: TIGR03067 domain-containing protein [Planctomycetia bacterium]|nr:TIGR03067 domain-containing protein [Planctomycetia bacterium]